ncbi:replication-associated recombination protein A [Thermospira aquatica]|uniref:Replication-associated recombination protein A n=1 Tax=Thermospira aquatica TaxID=2828656 RepID=A0AAX3BCR0_9SPIR|nr:replication-associated recombination protein A [Thermospira aquatica]URA09945.1 replication-associated recombination protein A [Thermospira aquatica]
MAFSTQPLSKRMMPTSIEDFIGQKHLLGPEGPIRAMVEHGRLHSMIFYGPPACGKTSLAELLAKHLHYRYIKTHATTVSNDEIKKIVDEAHTSLTTSPTLVFVDEIHRLVKPKQDLFLPSIEEGDIILIGATTENPYFVLQPALRSRLFIYEFQPHSHEELHEILERAFQKDEFLKKSEVTLTPEAKDYLLRVSPDARVMLNTLEMAVLTLPLQKKPVVTREHLETIAKKPDAGYSEDMHYDVISAFIKSVRGSDPDAALYYLAWMLDSGEDPLFIARRLIILAAEDIGLAYPEALPHAVACYEAVSNIGMPEGRIILAETTVLLASVPKSNSAYIAIDKALEYIRKHKPQGIPSYLQESHFYGAKSMGRGVGYKYPHDYPKHYVSQAYTLTPVHFYDPGDLGFEQKLKNWLTQLKQNPSAEEK